MLTPPWHHNGRAAPAILGGRPACSRPLGMGRPSLPSWEAVGAAYRSMASSRIVTNHGPYVQELEARLATYLGVPEVACTCNGQSAVLLALRAAGIRDGEVIVPAYTFSATPHAVAWCGARPVFADIRPDTLCLDPMDAEARITDRTVAVMPVDVYGIAADAEAFRDLAERHGLQLLFDSAPAFGSRVADRPLGSDGHLRAFSFHATKAFTTMEGGCVTGADRSRVGQAAALRNFGQRVGPDCLAPGLNAKMVEICAAIGLENLHGLDAAVKRRNALAARYRAHLDQVAGVGFAEPPGDQRPTWLYFPIRVDPGRFGLDRDQLARALGADNIHVRAYFGLPCHRLSCYAGDAEASLPVTEDVAATVLALPVYNDMTDEECDAVALAIRRIHRHADRVRRHLV